MSIAVTCPACSFHGNVPDSFVGKSVRCRRCGTAIAVPSHHEALLKSGRAKIEGKDKGPLTKEERLAVFRQAAADELAKVQVPEMIDSFPFLQVSVIDDSRCCGFCRSQQGKILKTRECTIETLPPFHQCKNQDDGCRCTFIPISKWKAARLGIKP